MSLVQFSPTDTKEDVIKTIQYMLHVQQLEVVEENLTKPWGAYWRISDDMLSRFVDIFFKGDNIEISPNLPQSPKILLVAPNQRLSWQYHHRRAEIWKVVFGPAPLKVSETDEEKDVQIYQTGDVIRCGTEMRHRLMGGDNWTVYAEIWQHTDSTNPSEEEDNIRLQDDYGREGTNTRN